MKNKHLFFFHRIFSLNKNNKFIQLPYISLRNMIKFVSDYQMKNDTYVLRNVENIQIQYFR